MNSKGFSIVELVVVIAIVGVLLAIVTLNFSSMQTKAQIERQTRELFADLNEARIESLHRKRRHSIVLQPYAYTFRSYSSENEGKFEGTVVRAKNVGYEITKRTGSSAADDVVEFDIRGYTNDEDTYRINPVGTTAQVDCIVVHIGRTNMGKMEGGECVQK